MIAGKVRIKDYNPQPATYNTQHTAHNRQPITHNQCLQPTAYNPQPTTHSPPPTAHNRQLFHFFRSYLKLRPFIARAVCRFEVTSPLRSFGPLSAADASQDVIFHHQSLLQGNGFHQRTPSQSSSCSSSTNFDKKKGFADWKELNIDTNER